MQVHNGGSETSGVTTPVTEGERPSIATPAQLRSQHAALKGIDRKLIESAEKSDISSHIIDYAVAWSTLDSDLKLAERTAKPTLSVLIEVKQERLKFDTDFPATNEVAKRDRTIAVAAQFPEFHEHKRRYTPTREHIYELAKAWAPGNEKEKARVIVAATGGRLTFKSSTEDIRDIRKGLPLVSPKERAAARANRREQRRQPTTRRDAVAPSIQDRNVTEHSVTSVAKQELPQGSTPTVAPAAMVDLLPPNQIECDEQPLDIVASAAGTKLFRLEVDLVDEDSGKIVRHFTIKHVKKTGDKWSAFAIVAALKDELRQAQV